MVKLKTALDENKTYVNICDVNKKEKKKYYCPDEECNAELIPKKGKIKADHFAHKAGTPACYGLESLLHLLTKEVLSESRTLNLPSANIELIEMYNIIESQISEVEKEIGISFHKDLYKTHFFWELSNITSLELFEKSSIKLKSYDIKIERYLGKIKPDLILTHKESKRSLHIEVTVTHKIDENKMNIINQNDYAFLDIDLSSFYDGDIDYNKKKVKKILSDARFKWVNIPKRKHLIYKKKEVLNSNFKEGLLKAKQFYTFCLEPVFVTNVDHIFMNADLYRFIKNEVKTKEYSKFLSLYSDTAHKYFLDHFQKRFLIKGKNMNSGKSHF